MNYNRKYNETEIQTLKLLTNSVSLKDFDEILEKNSLLLNFTIPSLKTNNLIKIYLIIKFNGLKRVSQFVNWKSSVIFLQIPITFWLKITCHSIF